MGSPAGAAGIGIKSDVRKERTQGLTPQRVGPIPPPLDGLTGLLVDLDQPTERMNPQTKLATKTKVDGPNVKPPKRDLLLGRGQETDEGEPQGGRAAPLEEKQTGGVDLEKSRLRRDHEAPSREKSNPDIGKVLRRDKIRLPQVDSQPQTEQQGQREGRPLPANRFGGRPDQQVVQIAMKHDPPGAEVRRYRLKNLGKNQRSRRKAKRKGTELVDVALDNYPKVLAEPRSDGYMKIRIREIQRGSPIPRLNCGSDTDGGLHLEGWNVQKGIQCAEVDHRPQRAILLGNQEEMAVKAERGRRPDSLEGPLVHQFGDMYPQQVGLLHRRAIRDGIEPRPLPSKGRRRREARSIAVGQHIEDPRVLSDGGPGRQILLEACANRPQIAASERIRQAPRQHLRENLTVTWKVRQTWEARAVVRNHPVPVPGPGAYLPPDPHGRHPCLERVDHESSERGPEAAPKEPTSAWRRPHRKTKSVGPAQSSGQPHQTGGWPKPP